MSGDDTSIENQAFTAISIFVNELQKTSSDRSIKLYSRVLETLRPDVDTKAIKKHLDIFRNFCEANRDALSRKTPTPLQKGRISYSTRIFIDMNRCLSNDTHAETIWDHLLTIAALVDKEGRAGSLQALEERKVSPSAGGSLIEALMKEIDPEKDDDIMEQLLSSATFRDMRGKLERGDIDPMALIQDLIQLLPEEASSTNAIQNIMQQFASMKGNI